jgi:hypothetical protein
MKNRGGGGRAWSRGSGMGDVVLRGSSSGAPRSQQGGSGPLRSSSSAPMVSPMKTRHQIGVWIGKDQATTMRKGGRGHWCVLSPLRQITEQVRGKAVSSCTVAASVRGGRRSWKQLQRGSVAHGGELGRGDDGVLPRTGAAWHRGSRAASTSWAQRRRAVQRVQERRRHRFPRTVQSPPRPRQLQLRVGDDVHGSAWPSRAATRRLGRRGAQRPPTPSPSSDSPPLLPFLLPPFLSSFLPLISGRGCGGFGENLPQVAARTGRAGGLEGI